MKERYLLLFLVLLVSGSVLAQKPVEKTNPLKVYMHYMPWFETPETVGDWGWHWTMNSKNPDKMDATGKREIASHYYPLIGPYASRDQDVIEYHLLLMKLSGIDGVLINWYGTQGSNGDIEPLLTSSNAIVASVDDFGMDFGVILEDRFSRTIEDAKANMRYLRENYFNNPHYIRTGTNQDPFVGIFGPITFQQPAQWTEILAEAGEDVEFLTLWYESGDAGSNADGEYAWVYQDGNNHLTHHLENFYKNRAPNLKTAVGSAYPGFHDFYKEGGAGNGYFFIDHNGGATLDQTLAKAKQHQDKIDMLQLVTWNDFGEGTIFEPTRETGFEYLKKVQAFTGVSYGEAELKLVYKLYRLRKQHKDDAAMQQQLDQAAAHLANLEITAARAILDPIVLGLLDKNSAVREGIGFSLFPNPTSDSILQLKFDKPSPAGTKLTIVDATGKLVYQQKVTTGISFISIPVQALYSGIYTVRLVYKDVVATQRFAITR